MVENPGSLIQVILIILLAHSKTLYHIYREKIRIDNGSLALITNKGHNELMVLPYKMFCMCLKYLTIYLISKITRDLHCQGIFSPDAISFYDLSSRSMIALPYALHSRGLYFHDAAAFFKNCSRTSLLFSYFFHF